ncbi:MAG: phosphate signaling complex protein PhoU [Syntrophaceae bacterium]|nr:phosphate signaling complex protein PhoU [Candidatus Omnitrophota bacterium]MCG2739158.1 phosphate signaling complex protein PhoU [Syntrophaceae bacterium]
MQRHFDEELEKLKEKILKMSSLVEKAIHLSIKALVDRESELAQQIIKSDDQVNMLEIEIDEFSLKLLALRQPQAGDLRLITSIMKINNDLERIGDLAVNISERTIELLKFPIVKPLIDIPRMAEIAQGMVKDSLDAFVNRDSKLARSVCERDDKVDNLNDQIFRELLTYMLQDPKTIERAVDLILVGRNLERIADHATNICEDVIYIVDGKTIKHHIEEREIKDC